MGSLNDPAAWTDDALGEIPASVELKLVDATELGYSTKNNPPQGEVWIRGAAVTEGYLDLEKENKEAFTEDGWFKTGDIG
jgi:long-chain acyl-CoA synthetase